MAYYSREEQETLYNYDPIDKRWSIYSSYPRHIRQLLERADIQDTEEDSEGRVIGVRGYVEQNQVRLFKPR